MAYSTQGNDPVRIVSKVRIVLCTFHFLWSYRIRTNVLFVLCNKCKALESLAKTV